MAGGGSSEDENPVAIQIVPLIDIIFCLCVFFFCSIHFKALEGRIESWLPKEKGLEEGGDVSMFVEDVRVFLKWDGTANRTIRQVGPHIANSNEELGNLVVQLHEQKVRAQQKAPSEVPVEIDAQKEVPWAEVVTVMDICKQKKILKIEFASSIGYRIEKYK